MTEPTVIDPLAAPTSEPPIPGEATERHSGATTLLTVMVYDITDDRRRRKMHALLLEYGVPVQRSAFEGRLTPSERRQLAERAAALVEPVSDTLVMYTVAREQERAIRALGLPRPQLPEQRWFIV
jgi:CRISPR-associated protein Cas2